MLNVFNVCNLTLTLRICPPSGYLLKISFRNSTSGGVVCPNLPVKSKPSEPQYCKNWSFYEDVVVLILPPPLRPLPSSVTDTSGLPTGTKVLICTLSSSWEGLIWRQSKIKHTTTLCLTEEIKCIWMIWSVMQRTCLVEIVANNKFSWL